jgi:HK97 gp10 family phage protein
MKVQVRFEGGLELSKALATLSEAVSRKVQVEALTAGGTIMQRIAAAQAPRSQDGPPHLADHIVVGAVSARKLEARGRASETVVEVGLERKPTDVFYGVFQEYGTVRHAAQPFMRPAFDQGAQRSLDVIRAWLWHAIRKRVPGGG